MRRYRWLRLWPALLLVVAGCTSSHKTVGAPTTPSASTTASTTMVSIPATTSGSGPPSTLVATPSVTASRCQASNLRAAVTGQGGAAGHGGEVVVLTLVGGPACALFGYPGLGLKAAGNQTVPLTVSRQTQKGFLFPYVPAASVLVTAATPASFGIEWINDRTPAATTLVVTPPNDTPTIVATGGVQGGVPNNTTVTVTAVAAGQLQGTGQ